MKFQGIGHFEVLLRGEFYDMDSGNKKNLTQHNMNLEDCCRTQCVTDLASCLSDRDYLERLCVLFEIRRADPKRTK